MLCNLDKLMHFLYRTMKRNKTDRLLIAATFYRTNAQSVRNHRTKVELELLEEPLYSKCYF